MRKEMWGALSIGLGAVVLTAVAVTARAQIQPVQGAVSTEQGFGIFQTNCLTCHGTRAYPQAPSPIALRDMTPERIYEALTTGVMQQVGATLTDQQKRMVSESAAGRLLGSSASGDAKDMPNRCAPQARFTLAGKPGWADWGAGGQNLRYQTAAAAGLTAADVPKLKLKWVFGLPNSTSSYSQPTVAGGRVFVGADTGAVYALDQATGCVHWSFEAKSGVRAAPVIGPPIGGKGDPVAYIGDLRANVYALNARTGEQLWTVKVDDELATRVTASPTLYQGRLYVPLSAWEEFAARTLEYPCCTSVGALLSLDAATGKIVWKSYVIPERPKPTRVNSRGVQQYGPAGGAVWNSPTVDPVRKAVYIGTGDATTFPAAATSDAVAAFDMASGKMLWSYQIHANDSFLVGCQNQALKTDNCPQHQGPDWDIPNPAMLKTLPGGKRVLLIGTKPGDLIAVDPDNNGKLLWRVNVHGGALAGDATSPVNPISGMIWGGAADSQTVYYGLTGGGMAAFRIADGKLVWRTPINSTAAAPISHGSPATAIPGAVFVGGIDGRLNAVSTADGKLLWSVETAKPYDAVNKTPTKGGSIISGGPTVAGGMLFIGSGYAVNRGMPGNAVLAFGK
jgi:polyvinyl alcohol dehydrogenase (cytochrome)